MLLKATHNKPQGLIRTSQGLVFIKRGSLPHLKAEKEGLCALKDAASSLIIPEVLHLHSDDLGPLLVLTGLDLKTPPNWNKLAHGLTQIHAHHNTLFGWHQDNWIGLGLQKNDWCDSWSMFFTHFRLKPKLRELEHKGFCITPISQVLEVSRKMLQAHTPIPSLVHGDLWSGNIGFTSQGAAIFDPAVYYGDREVDLAMARLFGGFCESFYTQYQNIAPLPAGFEQRLKLYNLYHLLNHACLFGGSYISACKTSFQTLLKTQQ